MTLYTILLVFWPLPFLLLVHITALVQPGKAVRPSL